MIALSTFLIIFQKKKRRGVDIAYKFRFLLLSVFEIPEIYIQNRTALML